jgi:hypothetical protein
MPPQDSRFCSRAKRPLNNAWQLSGNGAARRGDRAGSAAVRPGLGCRLSSRALTAARPRRWWRALPIVTHRFSPGPTLVSAPITLQQLTSALSRQPRPLHPSTELDGRVHGRWLEVMDCEMAKPAVPEGLGIDLRYWSGFAAGAGMKRCRMVRHGINDSRCLSSSSPRVLKQF